MNKITSLLKSNLKFILIYIVVLTLLLIELPYYIDAPGGLIDISERIKIEGKYQSEGSLNLAYVSEYKGTIPMLFLSLFNKDWTVNKKVSNNEKDAYEEALIRDKLWIKESYANAIILAYHRAEKDIIILKEEVYVLYVHDAADTDLEVGDKIVAVDDLTIVHGTDLSEIIASRSAGDRIEIHVENNGKNYTRYAMILETNGSKFIGIVPANIRTFRANPKIELAEDASESGPSGGLMIALAVYNAIVPEDITGGLTIVGTGTIDLEGNVGEIGGIEYKIKGAARKKADIFFVPAGDNYEDAKKIVEKRNYKITLVPIATFDEALDYLEKNVAK